MTMAQIDSFMSGFATPERWPILDRTGLPDTMRYNIDVQFTLYTGPTVETLSGPPLMAGAMTEQLGLKLEPRREPREVLIIDRATMPPPD
jgi:uncharacterized protein (TIGR03435 family)